MALTETFGKYQLHLIPFQLSETGQWAPYLMIHKFNEENQRFICVLEKHRVSGDVTFTNADEAVDEARRVGNALIASGKV
ncbi:MAG TPA: hypothetical protein VJ577_05615 [Burkholderiaceae bacterium]|nr:hypothetical protein [Burkholderiaceae bacterium]